MPLCFTNGITRLRITSQSPGNCAPTAFRRMFWLNYRANALAAFHTCVVRARCNRSLSPPAKRSAPALLHHRHRFLFFLLRARLRLCFDEAQARRLFRMFEQQALEVCHGLGPRMGLDECAGLELF